MPVVRVPPLGLDNRTRSFAESPRKKIKASLSLASTADPRLIEDTPRSAGQTLAKGEEGNAFVCCAIEQKTCFPQKKTANSGFAAWLTHFPPLPRFLTRKAVCYV